MSMELPNPEIYSYTDSEDSNFIMCDTTFYNTGNQVGYPIDESIYMGGVSSDNNPANMSFYGLSAIFVPVGGPVESAGWVYNTNGSCELVGRTNSNKFMLASTGSSGIPVPNSSTFVGSVTLMTAWRNRVYNLNRWYSDQSTVPQNAYGFTPVIRVKPSDIVLSFTIQARKQVINDFTVFATSSEYSAAFNNTLKSFNDIDSYLAEASNYPCIVSITLNAYVQQPNQSGYSRSDRNLDILSFVSTDIPNLGLHGDYSDGNWSWTKTILLSEIGGEKTPDYADIGLVPQNAGANILSCPAPAYTSASDMFTDIWLAPKGISADYKAIPFIIVDGAGMSPTNHSKFGYWVYAELDVNRLLDMATELGFMVSTSRNSAVRGDPKTDPNISIPEYDDEGNYKGRTNNPRDKQDSDYFDKDRIQPSFDPSAPVDPNQDKKTDEIDLDVPNISPVSVFNRTYAVSLRQLRGLSNYLWNANDDTFEKIVKGLSLMGTNPINGIISIFMYPFSLPQGAQSEITIGRNPTGVYGVMLSETSNTILDLGSCVYWGKYENFLDYEPFTSAWLYIPYVGIFKINNKEFLGKTVNVKLVADLMTGSGQVVVYADGIPMIYKNCKIGAQIAATGENAATIAQNYIAAGETALSAGISAASGNYSGMLTQALSATQQFVTSDNVPLDSKGSDSPTCGGYMPQTCYLIMERPKLPPLGNYGALIGYACYISGTIGSVSGFSVFDNVQLNVPTATAGEKDEIIRLLTGGVYV